MRLQQQLEINFMKRRMRRSSGNFFCQYSCLPMDNDGQICQHTRYSRRNAWILAPVALNNQDRENQPQSPEAFKPNQTSPFS